MYATINLCRVAISHLMNAGVLQRFGYLRQAVLVNTGLMYVARIING